MSSSISFAADERRWVTHTADAAEWALKSASLVTARYAEGYADLRLRTGRSFPNIEFALRHLPVANDGAWHKTLRRRASEHLVSRMPALEEFRKAAVDRTRAVFATPGPVDLMAALVGPLIADLIRALCGFSFRISPSGVFDMHLGLGRRRELEDELARVIAEARAECPDADDMEIGIRVAYGILGHDATMGTLGHMLARGLPAGEFRPIAACDWPDDLEVTGVPWILRQSGCPFRAPDTGEDGKEIPEGAGIRVDMTRFLDPSSGRRRDLIFGAGVHTCLGRPFTQGLWRDLAATLLSQPGSVRLARVSPSTNRVFDIPESIEATIRHD